tara:strand:- start:4429 stop:4980 length:552 start_codon:yes stop_codon:yes gene_type:complete
MSYTFDCANKVIQLDTTSTLEMGDLYSRWKDIIISDLTITGCKQALRVIKEPLQGSAFLGPYYFLMNDWQIRPLDSPHELVVDGTLVQDETSTVQSFKLDNLTAVVSIVREIAVSVQVIETGVTGLTTSESQNLQDVKSAMYNRSVLNEDDNTMTIYEADGTTVKQIFDLNIASRKVTERAPR